MLRALWATLAPPQPRRRGGWRQQLVAAEADAAAADEDRGISRLFGNHLLSWCEGGMSAARLQHLAASGAADGLEHPMLARMAQLREGQNAQASLIELLGTTGVPRILSAFPGEFVSHGVLPSSWFSLLRAYPHEFRLRLGAEKTKLRGFWRDFLSRPANADLRANHPIIGGMGIDELETVIPLTMHADAGPYSKTSACYVVSFGSLVGVGEAKLTKFMCASYVQRSGQMDDSLWWHRVLEDMAALGSGHVGGRAVARDSDGTLWRGALVFVKCDEDVRANDFGLTHFSGGNEVCPDCLANRTTRPFTDMTEGAAWRRGEGMSFDVYKARAREPHHPLVANAHFCHRFFFPIDIMHLLECKGVTLLVFGSAMMWLLADARVGANKEERLEAINARREQFYDARCAAPFFRDVVFHYCGSMHDRDQQLRRLTAALDDLYTLLYDAPMFPPDATVVRVRQLCLAFGSACQRLRELSRRAGVFAFAVTPKVHEVQHIPLLTSCINPVRVQVYSEESMMGSVTGTWRGSKNGRCRQTVQKVVLIKQVTGLLLRFELDT
ncbi:unnamed protein product [Prorocentrum cordatum]|uniref:Uncharacterized protein n=1 Tax=Prorocentrum cordatum TaxID=2364126 RepID=A0ABN9TP75_9DINO|nr:unnamed protein product [Polarella glacialis]